MQIKREQQKAQNPGKMGRNQGQTVPTHEGSQLNKPMKAGVSKKDTPHL